MGSMKLAKKIPTIDFSLQDLKPGSTSWDSTCKQVRCAFEEYSCFLALYPQVSPQLLDGIFGQSKELFNVPNETKVKNTSVEPRRGYLGPLPHRPFYESLGIDNVTSPQETQKFRDLMWPDGNTKFCETTDMFAKLLGDLKDIVEKMLFESFGVSEEKYESLASSKTHILRFNKYKIPEDRSTPLRLVSHTDIYFVSTLVQHDVGGLEIQAKDGDWIGFENRPSQFLFMAGDAFQVWSNDRVKACLHRVSNYENTISRIRYSIGMYSSIDRVFQIPEELVDDNHPLVCNEFDSCGYVRFYTTEEAKKAKSPLKAYIGVEN